MILKPNDGNRLWFLIFTFDRINEVKRALKKNQFRLIVQVIK